MNLLLTNDDGYEAQGINVLAETLSEKHNVFIIAPDGNRSAISHGITMFSKLNLKKIRENVWSCSGKPADCVIVALKSNFLPVKIDAVISGINHGANLGTDIVYSGTCAASREAVLDGIPALAVSLEYADGKIEHFKPMASFVLNNLEKLLSLSQTDYISSFVNINALSLPEYKEAVLTNVLANRKYRDTLALKTEGDETETTFLDGELIHPYSDDSDAGLCYSGKISVSVVCAEPCISKVDDITFSI